MGVLGAIRIDGTIDQIVSQGSLGEDYKKNLAKLQKSANKAIPKLADRLDGANQEQAKNIINILSDLTTLNNSEYFKPLFSHQSNQVRDGVIEALAKSPDIDPNRFVDLFEKQSASKPMLISFLTKQKQRVNGSKLLRYAYKLEHNDQAALFKLLESIAGDTIVPELVNRVDTKDPIIRTYITKVLSKFDTPSVNESLSKLLSDENKAVRLAALDGLSRSDKIDDIEQLCKLISDPDFKVQNKAIEAIVKVKHPKTVLYLIPHLKDESEYVRRAAVEVLNEIASKESVKDLLNAIKDEDWWVRSRAADALGKIGGKRVVQAVIQLIKDDDEFIRRSAIEIINATKDESTFDALVQSLDDSDWWVRERAIDGLAELGNKKCVPVLINMLSKNSDNEAMVVVLLKAFATLKAEEATTITVKQLKSKSENVVKEAIKTLITITGENDVEVVVKAIDKVIANQTEEVQELGQEAINRIVEQEPAGSSIQVFKGEDVDVGKDTVAMSGSVKRGDTSIEAKAMNPEELQPDDMLADRYRYIKKIGKGAFGSVFLMEDTIISEEIILKFLNAQFVTDESIIKRFIYELRFARKITHPNVIRIYDMLSFGKAHAISMEYFRSHTLSAEVKDKKPMDIERAKKFTYDVCSGMESAHAANVVHRDLKPNNILIDENSILKIVDFGVAAATQSTDTKLTKTGLLVGTPTYMAPEQVLGKDVDERTDIYSLGAIMYEMLTGRPPYSGKDSMSIMYQHVQGKAEKVCEKNELVTQELSDVVSKAMSVKAEHRYQSMTELKNSIEQLTE
ncbi:MAG: protein kinase domain-containing protein [Gammaproteobacteria bacterium]